MKPDDLPSSVALEAPAAPGTVAPQPRTAGRLRALARRHRLFLALVVLPLTLATVYFVGLAQQRYVSTAVLTVRRAAPEGVSSASLSMLLAGAGSHEDTRYLRVYLQSMGLMRKLDERLQVRRHFESTLTDPFYRLWPQASREWMLEYWRARVDLQFDELSGLLTIRVEGFDADFAQRLNEALLQEGEAFVNGISQRIAREQMSFAESELNRTTQSLEAARSALLAFQSRNQVLDPIGQAQASGILTAELRAALAKVEAELGTKLSYLNADAPEIVSLQGQAAALRAQAAREVRGATQPAGAALNRLAVEFHALKARAGFAEDAYKTALVALETTRMEAVRKVKSLVVVEAPTRADSATFPSRLYALTTALVAMLLIYAAARLVLATIDEHRD